MVVPVVVLMLAMIISFCTTIVSLHTVHKIHSYEDSTFVWLYSCEQNSCQSKSDRLPDITRKFKRYQHEANERDSTSAKKREKSPTRRRESAAPARKQTKSSGSVKETPQKQAAAPHDSESAPDQHSDVPVCAGKQSRR